MVVKVEEMLPRDALVLMATCLLRDFSEPDPGPSPDLCSPSHSISYRLASNWPSQGPGGVGLSQHRVPVLALLDARWPWPRTLRCRSLSFVIWKPTLIATNDTFPILLLYRVSVKLNAFESALSTGEFYSSTRKMYCQRSQTKLGVWISLLPHPRPSMTKVNLSPLLGDWCQPCASTPLWGNKKTEALSPGLNREIGRKGLSLYFDHT